MCAAVAHVREFSGGKIVRFDQYVAFAMASPRSYVRAAENLLISSCSSTAERRRSAHPGLRPKCFSISTAPDANGPSFVLSVLSSMQGSRSNACTSRSSSQSSNPFGALCIPAEYNQDSRSTRTPRQLVGAAAERDDRGTPQEMTASNARRERASRGSLSGD